MGKPSVSKKISAPVNNVVSSPVPQPVVTSQPKVQPQPVQQPQQPQQPQQQQNQVPPQPTTPQISVNDLTALQQFANLDDRAMARAVLNSNNVDLPIILNDLPSATQNLVYSMGMNEKPMAVLSNWDFNNYLTANAIPKAQVMFRSSDGATIYDPVNKFNFTLTPDQVLQNIQYGDLTYIGGKKGGMLYGAGTYFDMDATGRSIYGSRTIKAVLSPKASSVLRSDVKGGTLERTFASKYPLTYAEMQRSASRFNAQGSSKEMISLVALGTGHNVVRESNVGGYVNVILRDALILNKNIF